MASERKLTASQVEFLTELNEVQMLSDDPWQSRRIWTPPFPLSVIDSVERRGFIETRGDRKSYFFAYRITDAGRAALRAMETPNAQ